MAGQETAWRVVHAAKATIDRVRYLSVQRPAKRKTILVEHRRIVSAVVAQNEATAAEAMHAHLQGVFASTERIMRQHPEFFGTQPDSVRPNRRRRAS